MGPAHVDSVLHFSAKYMFVSLHTCKAVRSSLRQEQRTLVLMVHAFSILCGLYLLFRVLCVPAQPIESHVLWTGSSWSRGAPCGSAPTGFALPSGHASNKGRT